MRYLLKYLQRVGLLSTLLIGGVLSGLMAPLPSEASGTTLKLKVDGGTEVNILGALQTGQGACVTNICYAVGGTAHGGSPDRSFSVVAAQGSLPRLNITDLGGQDAAKLTGVAIIPTGYVQGIPGNPPIPPIGVVWGANDADPVNTNETHILYITMTNTFDVTPNDVGYAVIGLRSGGSFIAGPTALPATGGKSVSGDSVSYGGTGTFCPALTVTCTQTIINEPLRNSPQGKAKVAGSNPAVRTFQNSSTVGTAYFTTQLDQVVTYPTFLCDTGPIAGTNKCAETITTTYTITLKGPDVLILSDSTSEHIVPCNLVPPGPPLGNPAIPCGKNGKGGPNQIISDAFAAEVTNELATLPLDAVRGVGCTVNCTGTITILKNLDVTCYQYNLVVPCTGLGAQDFTFSANTGASSIVTSITTDGTGNGSITLSVPVGTYDVVESPREGWTLNAMDCGDGAPTTGVVVTAGGNVVCSFTNRPPPLNFSSYGGHDYIVIHQPSSTWANARKDARSLGLTWDLATITSAGEQTFIAGLLDSPLPEILHQYWIGGEQLPTSPADEPAAKWQWINGEGLFWNISAVCGGDNCMYHNWGAGEPNNVVAPGCTDIITCPQNHVAMDSRYDRPQGWGWDDNDYHLSDSYGYVAERVSPAVIP